MIELQNISKFYGHTRALDQCSLKVNAGEIVGLVGKNGAGKSTALRILSCQMPASKGDVWVDGVSAINDPLEVKRRIGYLPETPPLYPEMRVADYLDFAARLRGLNAVQTKSRREIVMKETGLAHVAEERLGNLSRGYQQRVGIAQAIIHQPLVLLLDEPMAGLDPLQIVQIRELIRGLGQQHTVLFSSHILSEITNVCDRVVLIDQGVIRAEGSEAHLRESLAERRRLFLQVRGQQVKGPQLKDTVEKARQVVKKVPGVEVESDHVLEDGTVGLHLLAKGEVREQLSDACMKAGLGLLELRTERHGLEDLFIQLLEEGEKK